MVIPVACDDSANRPLGAVAVRVGTGLPRRSRRTLGPTLPKPREHPFGNRWEGPQRGSKIPAVSFVGSSSAFAPESD